MLTDSGGPDFDPTDALMDVTMEVSRAHLLLTGTLDWVPRPVRRHTNEALDILDEAVGTLRGIAVALHAQALEAEASRRDPQGA